MESELLIPAICSGCPTIWLSPAVGMPANSSVIFRNTTIGACPKCGMRGRIPDGRYTLQSIALYSQRDVELVISALRSLQGLIQTGANSAAISKEIDTKHPFLAALKNRIVPTNATETNLYLVTLLGFLTLLLPQCKTAEESAKAPPPVVQIFVQQEIAEAIVQASADQKTTPQKIQSAPPAPHQR